MSDENRSGLNKSQGTSDDLTIAWKETPMVLVDSVVGYVTVGNVSRITLGQISFRGANVNPGYVPAITLAVPIEGLRYIAAQLAEIIQQVEGPQTGTANDKPKA